MDNEFDKYCSEELTEETLETECPSCTANTDKKDEAMEVDSNKRVEIVGVKFKNNGKTYHFAPNGEIYSVGDNLIVDTARGQEYGTVSIANREISASEIVAPLRSVLRVASESETKIHEENIKKEIEAYNTCIALIDRHKLEMKLIDAEISFDRSKILFYFSSEGRVDFRDLVKDLASTFHTRIEMRQIGIRDEAKILGGLGICGRPFCCSSFLQDFVQVSVKMAKEQNLSLNAAKISGSCGRLMCCLRYEYDTYLAEKALTPKVDTRVMTPDGPGVVTDANPLAGIVKVRLDSATDDSTQVVFVREDVVKESEYNGEKLTKSEVPNRSRKSDKELEFVPAITIEAPISEAAVESEAPKEQSNRRNDRGDRNDRKNRQDKFRQQPGKVQNRPEAAKDSQGESDKKTQSDKTQQNQNIKRRDERENRSDNQSNRQKNAPATNEAAKNENAPAKKKHRPYYRNFRKNRGSGDGKNKS